MSEPLPLSAEERAKLRAKIDAASNPGDRIWQSRLVLDLYELTCAALEARVAQLEGELRSVDAVLARRPAIDDLPTRYAKIERACSVAGRCDQAERRVAQLEGENERLKERAKRAFAICGRISERPTTMGYEDIEDIVAVADLLADELAGESKVKT